MLDFGNHCGHVPWQPRLVLEKPPKGGKGGIPPVLVLASERIQEYYNRPAGFLPSLNNANGSDRQQRSERREACILVCKVLFQYLDLVSLTVAIPSNQKMQGITFPFIAARAGISLRRCERAVQDLKSAGLLKVDPISKKEGDQYKGLAAVKSIPAKLFQAIGLDKKLKKERQKKTDRLTDQQKRIRQLPGNSRRSFAKFTLGMKINTGSARQNDHMARMTLAKAAALKEQNPSWSAARCNAEALKSL